MTTPTRFISGISTEIPNSPLGMYPLPNPMLVADYDNDFFQYVAADWTVTTSTGSTALVAGPGGLVLQSTAASLNDIQANVKNPACLSLTAGNRAWFMWQGQLSDANLSTLQVGMQAGGTFLAPTDGVYFNKPSGGTVVNLLIEKASTITTIPMTGANFANATNLILAWYYDGGDSKEAPQEARIEAWAGTFTHIGPNRRQYSYYYQSIVATENLTNLPVVNLSPAFGLSAGAGAIKTMQTDYILAAASMTR